MIRFTESVQYCSSLSQSVETNEWIINLNLLVYKERK